MSASYTGCAGAAFEPTGLDDQIGTQPPGRPAPCSEIG